MVFGVASDHERPETASPAAEEIMTTAQAAQFLHVTPQTLLRFVRDGLLTAHRLPGARQYLFWRHAVVDLVEAHRVTPGDGAVEYRERHCE